ncbi:MAG: hypothetical protein AB1757_21330 [Acidobacteriota bacterium]
MSYKLKEKRTSFTRIRVGVGDVVIDPAWLDTQPSTAPKSASAVELGMIVYVRVEQSLDVKIGDCLRETGTMVKLFVYDVGYDDTNFLFSCIEIFPDVIKRERPSAATITLDATWFYPHSSGFAEDVLGFQRMAIRTRRSADTIEGDIIYNETTGERFFVYEVIYQQITKVLLCLKLSGQTLARQRYGVADVTIDPAWLQVLKAGTRKAIITSGAEVGISAEMRARNDADIKVGDTLYYAARGQRFNVQQVIAEAATLQALLQQIPRFIPDEFDNLFFEPFWSQRLNGGAISETSSPGSVEFTAPSPAVQLASNGLFVYQTLSGDFDVFARISVSNTLTGAQLHFGYLGARIAASVNGVYIGNKGYAGGSDNVRLDQYGASAGQQDESIDTTAKNFVRIKRTGAVFHTYYSNNGASQIPSSESDWIEVEPAGTQVTSAADVEVGLGCYKTVGAAANVTTVFYVRNGNNL